MSWKGKKVLVTGAGGFIGSHLVERLVNEGADVRAFLRYTADKNLGNLAYLDKNIRNSIDYFFGDVRDFQAVASSVEKVRTIFHLAAVISIPYSILHPVETFQVNACGTLNLLEAARRKGTSVSRLVLTSTSEVYGSAVHSPMKENHQQVPQSPYAASKIAADSLAQSYFRSYALPVTVLRPFNTYGPRQSDRAVLPSMIAQALWKDVIEVGDTRPQRDFTFVLDTVDAFLLAATRDKAVGQSIHLGTGRTVSIKSALAVIQSLLGIQKKVVSARRRFRPKEAEVTKLLSNPAKAKNILSWRAKISLEEGLKKTIEWIQQHRQSYHPAHYRI